MDTDALWQAIVAYGNARRRGYSHEIDAEDHLSEIKEILNRSEAEARELLADNDRLVDEVAELKAAYESQFKELHELKAKLTDKASLLRGCYARINWLEKALRELHDATQLVSVGNYNQEAHDIAVSRARAALEKKHEG